MRLRRARSLALPFLLPIALLVAGCSSLFSRSIDRGDELAALGRWDDAASQYERATRLDPEDADARAKLAEARRHQASERVARGEDLLAHGKPREALRPFLEATRLDPSSRPARDALERARALSVQEARRELDAGNTRQALLEAREILAVLPADPDAAQIDQRARTIIADEATARGQEFEKAGQLSAALVEYAEALVHRPEHGVANARFAAMKSAVAARVTYHVILGNFDGDPKADGLGGSVGAADLANGLDPKYLVRVSSSAPPSEGFQLNGMRLGGAFHDYSFKTSRASTARSCDFVCGTDVVANPEYGRAEADLREAELDRATAEVAANAASARVPPLERALHAAHDSTRRERRELDAARTALAQCESISRTPATDCAGQRAVRDHAQGEVDRAEADERRAESELSRATTDAASAESDRSSRVSAAMTARARFDGTPAQVSVDRHCNYAYDVDIVSERGAVELSLAGEGLYDEQPTLVDGVTGQFAAQDETFPPEGGKCALLERGDPLVLPPESDVRRRSLESAIALARGRVLAQFERYRADYLTRARAAEVDKKSDQAVESYVRYLVTATGPSEDGDRAIASVSSLLGVTPDAVRKAASP